MASIEMDADAHKDLPGACPRKPKRQAYASLRVSCCCSKSVFKTMRQEKTMNIKEYMREIYMRVLYTLFSVIITCICAYAFSSQLIYILAAPLEEAHNARNEIFCALHNMTGEEGQEFHFIFTEITEAFMASTQLSMFMALYLQFPIILY